MIRISILYPNNGKFDIDYYLNTHMPLSIKRLSAGQGYQGVSVERGLSGAIPSSAPNYVALCHYLFDSVENFMAAFVPYAAELKGDIPNYTDIEPIIQFSEVILNR